MIDKSLEIIKEDLKKEGFYDVLLKETVEQELERVLN